jgi:hypothetical protein
VLALPRRVALIGGRQMLIKLRDGGAQQHSDAGVERHRTGSAVPNRAVASNSPGAAGILVAAAVGRELIRISAIAEN